MSAGKGKKPRGGARPTGGKLEASPEESARRVGLRYVSDDTPGLRREKAGAGFNYFNSAGRRIRDARVLGRIKSLVIPPAWTKVWICPLPDGHLQATGRDQRGRKQYRYHPRWREVRDDTKYERMVAFAQALPRIRQRTQRDFRRPDLSRLQVLATVVRLLETSLIRVGNEEYAKANHSFGLTTMRDRHVIVRGSRIRFQFRGKSGKYHEVDIQNRRLARAVKDCQDIPGQELFQYYDEKGHRQKVDSSDVNDYLRQMTGQEFTAKDFRTWAGTVLAALALYELGKFDSQAAARRNVTQAVESVARRLGNTPAICRKCYIHPAILQAYLAGSTVELGRNRASRGLRPEEAAVLAFLRGRLASADEPLEKKLRKSLHALGRGLVRKA